jgi:hypothetical protein
MFGSDSASWGGSPKPRQPLFGKTAANLLIPNQRFLLAILQAISALWRILDTNQSHARIKALRGVKAIRPEPHSDIPDLRSAN